MSFGDESHHDMWYDGVGKGADDALMWPRSLPDIG